MTVMRRFLPLICLGLIACEPTGTDPSTPKGPPIEIVEAGRKLDTVRVAMRYKDGSEIPEADKGRAMARAMGIACRDNEDAIADTTERKNGILTAYVFCLEVLATDQVIDGSGFRGA